jgi:hypothetical protein
MTYGERACFSLVSDPQIIPDATEIKRAFIGEFHALTALSPVDRGQS